MYKCTQCEQRFYSKVDCGNHIEEEHPEEENAECSEVHFRCPTCGRMFAHPSGCQNHAYLDHRIFRADCAEVPVQLEAK